MILIARDERAIGIFVQFIAGCVTMQNYLVIKEGRLELGVIGDQEYTVEDETKFPLHIKSNQP